MILAVKNLRKSFGNKTVLDGVSFGVDAGECVGIVGRSGCGKSTLAKIIARLIPAEGGEIFQRVERTGGLNDSRSQKSAQKFRR